MVTLKEIAEICNVSATTVSNVVNGKAKTSEETKQRILDVIKETGYKPNYVAKGLRARRTRTIAIVAEDIAQFTSPAIIESIMEYCEERRYRVTVHNLRLYDRWADTWYKQDDAYHSVLDPVIKDVLASQVDGIIYLAGHTRVIRIFEDNFPVPAVMCYALSESANVPSVVIEDELSAFEVTTHLINSGHKRIGVIGGRSENIHTAQRLLGYQKALYENGLLYDPKLVYYGDWSRESGYDGAKELLKEGISAIFALCDKMAGGAYDYLDECGIKIGEEISVAGFDDESIAAYFRPQLTTTSLPLAEIGRKSAKLLLDRLEDTMEEEESDQIRVYRIPCSMVIRKSVSKLKK